MATIGIAVYSIKVRHKGQKDFLIFGERNINLKSFLVDFFNTINEDKSEIYNDNYVLIVNRMENNGSLITGVISCGEYGYAADGIHAKTRVKRYERTPEDAEMMPFYFLAYTPDDKDTGIFMIQRHGNRGIYTALTSRLKLMFSKAFPEYHYYLNPHVPPQVLKLLCEGGLKSIDIISYKAPSDLCDTIEKLGYNQEETSITISIKPKKDRLLGESKLIKSIRNGEIKTTEIVQELGYLPDKIQISVEYSGKTRKINIFNPDKVTPYIDISNEVEILQNGHPKFDSINKYCNNLLDSILIEIGVERYDQ